MAGHILAFLNLLMLSSAAYVLVDDYSGEALLSNFSFFTGPDPTQGFVEYLGESESRAAGLVNVTTGDDGQAIAYIGVDSTNLAPNGRASVRISSNKAYNDGLFVADFKHVPGTTCGTWPAFWMVGPDWPHGGEIDIYEGVNLDYLNGMTLHTGPNCIVTPQRHAYTGIMVTQNCDVNAPDQEQNKGCQIKSRNRLSFANAMNDGGGGVFASEWNDTAITIWYFARAEGIPQDILSGDPQPDGWGIPEAMFGGNGCYFGKSFANLSIVFDITFCGQWAGGVWQFSPCSSIISSCKAFVEKFPSAFRDSYWEVRSVKVYQKKN